MTPPFAVIVAIFLLRGFLTGHYNLLVKTVMQEVVPAGLRGRVFGTQAALGQALLPLGFVAGGVLTDRAGVVPTLLVMAAAYGAATLWLVVAPGMRAMARVAAQRA